MLSTIVLACGRKPAVTIEQTYEEHDERSSAVRIYAPRCSEFPTARYPDLPTRKRPDKVDVRVDLTLDETGNPAEVRATVLTSTEDPEPFVKSAEAAAYMIHCQPALRTPRLDSGEMAPVPVRYQTSMVFHFFRDEREAKATSQ